MLTKSTQTYCAATCVHFERYGEPLPESESADHDPGRAKRPVFLPRLNHGTQLNRLSIMAIAFRTLIHFSF
ncbi:hypothetical protein [Ralstonia syzygii]|uniref:Uncharacterized protein n=1 Tax=Ralstonia syzygii R24 TaxID=907261 RepID=G3A9Q2_9RALS|nr:hypothetical protein [Ralstonia syzygii]CCA88018.1 hypothetical protein RALSY_mp10552 [Ralstonia syzygii R24]